MTYICVSKVKTYMAGRQWTNRALARYARIPESTLSAILIRCTCKPVTSARIAECFGVEVQAILAPNERKGD